MPRPASWLTPRRGTPDTRNQANTAARSPAPSEVLEALLWGFHNARSGRCFPSYEAIAVKAECCRDTVYEALKALELAGVLTWHHRIARIQVRERDLFGRWASRWRVIRTSNAYVFRDPQRRLKGVPAWIVSAALPPERGLRQAKRAVKPPGQPLLAGRTPDDGTEKLAA
jgi:Helix-turn-helix domain